jgi:predicted DNA-binding helix-hairpin-helix protein
MQVVIDISEKDYQTLKKKEEFDAMYLNYYEKLIVYGTPLPKGHGRIGDLDALEQEMINGIKAGNYEDGYNDYSHINNIDDCVDCVRCADIIIEAD